MAGLPALPVGGGSAGVSDHLCCQGQQQGLQGWPPSTAGMSKPNGPSAAPANCGPGGLTEDQGPVHRLQPDCGEPTRFSGDGEDAKSEAAEGASGRDQEIESEAAGGFGRGGATKEGVQENNSQLRQLQLLQLFEPPVHCSRGPGPQCPADLRSPEAVWPQPGLACFLLCFTFRGFLTWPAKGRPHGTPSWEGEGHREAVRGLWGKPRGMLGEGMAGLQGVGAPVSCCHGF